MICIDKEKILLNKSRSIHLIVAIFFTLLFIAINPSMGIFHMIGGFLLSAITISIISPLRFYLKRKWYSFFNQSQIEHEFKQAELNEQDFTIENLSKRILFQLYCKKNGLRAVEYNFYCKNYSKEELSLNNLINKLNAIIQMYPLGAEKIYQKIYDLFFKKDALVSYAMTHQEKQFIHFLIQHNLLKFGKEDLDYLNLGYNIHKSVATLLFQKEVYKTLPQELRTYLLTHISQKSKVLFEKDAILLEQDIQNNELKKKQIDEERKNDVFYELFNKSTSIFQYINEQIKEKLLKIHSTLQFLHDNYDYLSVEEKLEFNNIYQKMLPTYIDLFYSKNFANSQDFGEGINLIYDTLEAYKLTIIENNAQDFKTYHQYLTNKLNCKSMNSEA